MPAVVVDDGELDEELEEEEELPPAPLLRIGDAG
jgi:hypothetical protein